MFLLESAPIISDGPAWLIALSVVGGTLTALFNQFFPFLGKKYNFEECKKNCAALRAEFDAFKKKAQEEKEAKLEEIAGIKKRWKVDGDRLIRAEVLTKALKVTLNKQGYDDLIQLFEEVINKDAK